MQRKRLSRVLPLKAKERNETYRLPSLCGPSSFSSPPVLGNTSISLNSLKERAHTLTHLCHLCACDVHSSMYVSTLLSYHSLPHDSHTRDSLNSSSLVSFSSRTGQQTTLKTATPRAEQRYAIPQEDLRRHSGLWRYREMLVSWKRGGGRKLPGSLSYTVATKDRPRINPRPKRSRCCLATAANLEIDRRRVNEQDPLWTIAIVGE